MPPLTPPPRRGLRLLLSVTAGLTALPCTAWAGPQDDQPQQHSKVEAGPAPTPPPDDKFKRFDALIEPGLTTTYPSLSETVLRDAGGFRSALADMGIGFEHRSSTTIMDGFRPTGQPHDPWLYNGQRFTVQNSSNAFNFNFDLGKVGLDGMMVSAGIIQAYTNFSPNSPDTVRMRTIALYGKTADGRLEVRAGYLNNMDEYIGLFTGGSPILSAGLNGLVPLAAGLSAAPISTPAINVTLHAKDVYLRSGMQRSVSPRGRVDELNNDKGGFRFSQPGAGMLYISELGVKHAPSVDRRSLWARVGGFYNDSKYTRYDGRGTSANGNIYGAIDYQLTQPDKARPGAGIYVGASAFWAPDAVNVFTQSYELRTYAIGMIPGRPRDTVTVKAVYNAFGDAAVRSARDRGQYASRNQTNVTTSYSARVTHGVYAVPAISYIDNPSFTGDFKDTLIGSFTLYFML